MASKPVIVHVRPDGDQWQVTIGESPHLTLQSKDTAIAEAQVQAMRTRPSRIVVLGPDGQVEDEATFPADGTSGASRLTEDV